MILLAAGILSFALHEHTDGLIIIGIVLISGMMGFWREKGAADAVKRLLSMVQTKATCIRGGSSIDISTEEVVPGDLVMAVVIVGSYDTLRNRFRINEEVFLQPQHLINRNAQNRNIHS